MTSSGHERERRSAGEQVAMTAEHMTAAAAGDDDDAEAKNRASRLKRDLQDYLYGRRWNSPGKTPGRIYLGYHNAWESDTWVSNHTAEENNSGF